MTNEEYNKILTEIEELPTGGSSYYITNKESLFRSQ